MINILNKNYISSDKTILKEEIRKIFKYLRDTGEFPYEAPKVVFRKDDAQNSQADAQNINLPTAHYDPSTDTIVILIENGRHNRDLIISFLHELTHTKQNREDRLGDIQTDNVTEDGDLEKLEREAYEQSGIWFRKYKDSQKNPIQDTLSEYMRNIANIILEADKQYTIYVDLDDTLIDFDGGFKKLTGKSYSTYKNEYGKVEAWNKIEEAGENFWENLEWKKDSHILWEYLKKYNPIILTISPDESFIKEGKRKWVDKNISPSQKIIFAQVNGKGQYADENSILIDNKTNNIYNWIDNNGIGIHFTDVNDALNKIKQLGL